MAKPVWLSGAFARAHRAAAQARSISRDVLIGATGADAYGNYLAHARRHHPELTPLSRAAFAAEDLRARWHGVRRCC